MTNLHLWLSVIGGILIIAEILTGTLYLLLFGGALVASGLIANAFDLTQQQTIILTTVLSLVAYWITTVIRRNRGQVPEDKPLEVGQMVEVREVHGERLRVFYRGAEWDAVLDKADNVQPGERLIIVSVLGNELAVTRPTSSK